MHEQTIRMNQGDIQFSHTYVTRVCYCTQLAHMLPLDNHQKNRPLQALVAQYTIFDGFLFFFLYQ